VGSREPGREVAEGEKGPGGGAKDRRIGSRAV